jgi:uncharacterized protein YdhG (YjbR/CyaY superfamily)
MKVSRNSANPVEEYIALFPAEIQEILRKIRQVIHDAAPDAEEAISYQMPTFKLNGNLVHFAAFKDHIGFFPTPSGVEAYPELMQYKTGKGTLQFPLDEPIPYDLIRRVVEFRLKENLAKKK